MDSVNITIQLLKAFYHVTINSDPITGIPFTVDGENQQTPYESDLETGSHTIVMPKTAPIGTKVYTFQKWNDNSTNPSKTVNLTADTTLIATYGIGEPPFDWWQWLIDNWYIPVGAGTAILVLIALWSRQPPVIVPQHRKGKRLKHLSAQAT